MDQREFVGHRYILAIGGAGPHPHGVALVVMFHAAAGTMSFALEVGALDLDCVAHAGTMLLERNDAFLWVATISRDQGAERDRRHGCHPIGATRNRCGALLYTGRKRRYCQGITMRCKFYFGAKRRPNLWRNI